jgi:hypothetical protein
MNFDKDLLKDMGKDCYKTMRDLKHGLKLNTMPGMGILPKRLLDFFGINAQCE